MRDYKTIPIWKDLSPEKWNDWHWQVANRLTTVEQLKQVINMTPDEEQGVRDTLQTMRMGITPYYATLMDPDDPNCPVRLQAVPRSLELQKSNCDEEDPLFEEVDSPTPHLTHRYPDRVLFLITDQCTMYCRHCTRRRLAGETDAVFPFEEYEGAFRYLQEHTEVRDVIVSGGDPLTVSDDILDNILTRLRQIKHIEIIRVGSRVPVVCPQRITPELIAMMRKHHPVWFNTHFNNPKEFTTESEKALAMLADGGFPLGNQSVLLRGVNDCPHIMKRLLHKLVMNRVRPYYIYQCDMSMGIDHFRTSVGKGIEIMESLRGHTSGLCIPYYVIDAAHGGGKTPILPQYLISMSDRKIITRNYEGMISTYTEPEDDRSVCECKDCKAERQRKASDLNGMRQLFSGAAISIEPATTARFERRRLFKKNNSSPFLRFTLPGQSQDGSSRFPKAK